MTTQAPSPVRRRSRLRSVPGAALRAAQVAQVALVALVALAQVAVPVVAPAALALALGGCEAGGGVPGGGDPGVGELDGADRGGGGDDGALGALGASSDTVAVGAAPSTRAPRRHVLDLAPDRPRTEGLDSARVAEALARADTLPRLHCLLVARSGEVLVEHCRDGFRPDRPANVKSASKSVLSALVGIAMEDGYLEGVDQRMAPLLADRLPADADSAKRAITIGQLLSMQAGLERTSGRNYGAWVTSADWVRDALRRPMVAEPGGRMLYSTGNYHLLSAILTTTTGRSTLAYARARLGDPLGIRIPRWPTDPQGIFFGGNNMRLTPRMMVRFGELYRNRGRHDGREVVPESWVRASLEPRTRSPWSGEAYGYGWFLGDAGGYPMFYAWGYGGQFIFVVPDLELTVVTTSDPAAPRGGGHLRAVHDLLARWIVPAAEAGAAGPDQPGG